VDSVQSAVRLVLRLPYRDLEVFDNVRCSHHDSAAYGGADRLEICGNLGVGGGTTPSLGLVRAIQKAVPHLPLMVCKLSANDLSYMI